MSVKNKNVLTLKELCYLSVILEERISKFESLSCDRKIIDYDKALVEKLELLADDAVKNNIF